MQTTENPQLCLFSFSLNTNVLSWPSSQHTYPTSFPPDSDLRHVVARTGFPTETYIIRLVTLSSRK
ncbi:hypothetical protein ACSS6W_006394 [Trichoderma asperelloides]